MRRVLIATGIFPPDIGGPATYTKLLLEELPKRGFEVTALSYGEPQKGEPSNVHKVSRSIPKGLRHFIYFLKVWQLGRKADIIFAQDPVSAGLPAFLANKFLRRKFILKVVGDYAWEQGAQRFGVKDSIDDFQDTKKKYHWAVKGLKKVRSWVACGADWIIVPSGYLGRNVVQKWGVNKNKISVIYNGVEAPKDLPAKEELKKELKFNGSILVSVGRLVPWKGFEMLIRAVSELRNELKDLKLFIIGDGPDRKKLADLIKQLGLENEVILVGALPRTEVFKYIRAADAFVLNTAYEGFSHLLIEVLGLGTPVLASSAGGNTEILSDKNAEIFNFNDKERFKEQLVFFMKNSERKRQMVENGLRRSAEFSETAMINNVVKLLEKV
jgi:glycosyltransferase involved in cell wall biosynthesis